MDASPNPLPPGLHRRDGAPAGWATSEGLVPYPEAMAAMASRVEAILEGRAGELVWLLEHPPLYTAGVSARGADLLTPERFPVFPAARGGKHTYHGPGQRVAYVMLDLGQRERDVRAFVAALEDWLIGALADLGVRAGVRAGRVGVWVEAAGEERKIAAIGLKLRRWVSFHGVSLNVSPDLDHFTGINPCGLTEFGVTSLAALGAAADMGAVDRALKDSFARVFGSLEPAAPPL